MSVVRVEIENKIEPRIVSATEIRSPIVFLELDRKDLGENVNETRFILRENRVKPKGEAVVSEKDRYWPEVKVNP